MPEHAALAQPDTELNLRQSDRTHQVNSYDRVVGTHRVHLLTLKQRWHVSLGALLRRASDLGVMSDPVYTQAMRTVSARGWRISEPGELGAPESPRVLSLAIQSAGADTATLAAETGWPRTLIDEVVAASADNRPALEI